MTKTYITFGQVHVHNINGKTFDKDCVAEVNMTNEKARAVFWPKFHRSFNDLSEVDMSYFPRGVIKL